MNANSPKTILVTGASRGIGYLTAKTLAAGGHHVYAAMRDKDGSNAKPASVLTDYAMQSRLSLSIIDLDVTSEEDCQRAIAKIEAERPLDVLVNNAGVMPVGVTEAYSPQATQACFDVNMFGLAKMSQAALPAMRQRRSGLLIHLSSAAGRVTIPYFGIYCASKWAMEAYAESLNYELAPFDIQSVIIEPSGHATDLVKTAPAPDLPAVLQEYGPHNEGREKLLGMFHDLFAQDQAGNDAQNVADRIKALVEMQGPRPIRTQIGDDMGVSAINAATAPIQAGLIEQLSQVYGSEEQ
ncbi:SDR family oxidoreductase [Hyphomonas sp.]|uniref:SDR family oxidoreductase n=1 Tax=Hyphomonas sp. TaxID=87 RepID=UPI003001B9E9